MSRYRPTKSYGHAIKRVGPNVFRISYTYDRYYSGSRLRHPHTVSMVVDRDAAERFAKKWHIELPK